MLFLKNTDMHYILIKMIIWILVHVNKTSTHSIYVKQSNCHRKLQH